MPMDRINMYLWLDGVVGKSVDENHIGWIELTTFTWDVTNNATWQSAGQGSKGKGGQATVQGNVTNITATKKIDQASVTLFQTCMMANQIDSGIISCVKLDGEMRLEYFRIELQKIVVVKVHWEGIGGADVKEDVELNFGQFKEFYMLQGNRGFPGGVTEFGFDRETSTPI